MTRVSGAGYGQGAPLQRTLLSSSERATMFHVKPLPRHPALEPEAIASLLAANGITVTARQAQMLGAHAGMVLEANESVNLTRITDPESVARLHILDSLLPMTFESLSGASIIDVGSGAGFPGVPLAIMGLHVACCESRQKKAVVIVNMAHTIGLEIPVISQRAEELALTGQVWDVVIMRAVSALSALLELSAPLLTGGGRLLAMKGVRQPSEEESAARVAGLVGMRLVNVHEYWLPGGYEARTLYVFEKFRGPRIKLPRRAGLAQKQPLG